MRNRGRSFLILLAIGAFLAFINPYNATGDLSYPLALAYWTGMIIAGGVTAELCMSLYERIRPQGPVWGMLATGALTSAFSVTAFILFIEINFQGPVPMTYWPRLYGLVLVISIAITLIGYITSMAFDPKPEDQTANTNPTATFMARLPVKYRTATLHAIASEDHYLRVYTSLGEELILMRLADAEQELSGADGLRVHRSWWVAKAGVTDERKDNGRSFLILPSGIEVPISRSYRAKAKEAGFIS